MIIVGVKKPKIWLIWVTKIPQWEIWTKTKISLKQLDLNVLYWCQVLKDKFTNTL